MYLTAALPLTTMKSVVGLPTASQGLNSPDPESLLAKSCVSVGLGPGVTEDVAEDETEDVDDPDAG